MIRRLLQINAVIIGFLASILLLYPCLRAALDLTDPALRQPGTPQSAWRLYRNLTPRFAAWATARAASGRAEVLSTNDISGTEWPLFGSLFYLWGVENLQASWDAGDHTSRIEPRIFAHDAIVAASELVVDPRQAGWVRRHWGEDYLHRENLFYRMLLIGSLAAREHLLRDHAHLDLLRDQVESLASELDASATGLLDDYPGQCYPGDVAAAWACIKRADIVLGTDHSRLINRALRGFTGARTTRRQLPPYSADSRRGVPLSDARGCANSYFGLLAPELWPTAAREWFAIYDQTFWQDRYAIAGYREFAPNSPHPEWTADVDAGPVVAGFGVSASAFGMGASRKNGRLDRAYPLAAELLVTVGELPGGALAIPRLLSNQTDAPLLGEAAIFWQLSIVPEKGVPLKTGGALPGYVYVMLIVPGVLGVWGLLHSVWVFRDSRRRRTDPEVRAPGLQAAVWAGLLGGAIFAGVTGHAVMALVLLLATVSVPRVKKIKIPRATEDWETNSSLPTTKKEDRPAPPK